MNMMERQAEYIAVHGSQLDAIADAAEACLATFYPITGVVEPEEVILMQPIQASDFMEEAGGSVEEAGRLAAHANDMRRSYIGSSAGALLSWATDCHRGQTGNLSAPVLQYVTGLHREIGYVRQDRPDVRATRVSSLILASLDIYGGTKEYEVGIEDDALEQTLHLRYLGNELREVTQIVDSTRSGEVMKELHAAFGERYFEFAPMLCGNFRDEQELENGLAELWASFQERIPKERLAILLGEMRTQAQSAKGAAEMSDFDLQLPTADKLEEFRAILTP